MAPGFTCDEPLESLGRSLKLPPWQEPNRVEIEAGLPAIRV
jgi:glyoxalase family protein